MPVLSLLSRRKRTSERFPNSASSWRERRSTSEVRQIRDQIFLVEQARWITPEISILKAQLA